MTFNVREWAAGADIPSEPPWFVPEREWAMLTQYVVGRATYREIGKRHGISANRVQQLVHRTAQRLQAADGPLGEVEGAEGLSVRTKNLLHKEGLRSRADLDGATFGQLGTIENMGWLTLVEIEAWLGRKIIPEGVTRGNFKTRAERAQQMQEREGVIALALEAASDEALEEGEPMAVEYIASVVNRYLQAWEAGR